jgi:penicillin-binding protein 1C
MNKVRVVSRAVAAGVALSAGALWCAVHLSLEPIPEALLPEREGASKYHVLDRVGRPLSYTFAGRWNLGDQRRLHEFPELLQRAFIEAEDRRFYVHRGVDWRARMHAVYQNLKAGRVVRGASTITEQVVRMLHPRPRTLWSRLLEGVEARQLEARYTKGEILEFYLNQVPFAARRRGVVQAARYYWDRDLETLTAHEQLTLAVLVRAPERLDLFKRPNAAERSVRELQLHMVSVGSLRLNEDDEISQSGVNLARGAPPVRADHFVRYVHRQSSRGLGVGRIVSTVDAALQSRVQEILEARVEDLRGHHVTDGAVVVVDNRSAEVLAWANAGEFGLSDASQIDAVTTPRQPGSTLKPFLYALALSKGWTAATIIDDSPLVQPIGAGLHTYRNYSRMYYGPISLREALGNSLNTPAVRTIQFTGISEFLRALQAVGFSSLTQSPEFYGEGLALGNGEVSLLELVQGYRALADRGIFRPLRVVSGDGGTPGSSPSRRVISEQVSSIITNVLADPHARRKEFGSDGLMRFPVETAVKTGTSSDYRDAWAIGYNADFTVGVWMGNLNRTSMREITGARGPALVLRSVFAELGRRRESQALYQSPALLHRSVCSISGGLARTECPHLDEAFVEGSEPHKECELSHDLGVTPENRGDGASSVRLIMPTPGLNVARDPRIPDSLEALTFEIESPRPVSAVRWIVDGVQVGETGEGIGRYSWKLQQGRHSVGAEVRVAGSEKWTQTALVGFGVK